MVWERARPALKGLTGEAETLPYGLRPVLAAFVLGGPVRIDLGAGVLPDGSLDVPHRAEELAQPGEVGGIGDGQRQHHHRHHPVIGFGPLRGFVLSSELACLGSLHRRHLP
ncbi:hypothetical protein ACGFYQ_03680 [Streptomyces sp. NPDC048258]|uniref:hypothetical protein n=1 Tax=Streptomyces sp. NPDC048258 TaxID=3365527 RepID=UPI00371A8104